MLNKRLANFVELVWTAAASVGNSAPRVADAIIKKAFPQTVKEAEIEGAITMLRTGVINEVKSILRGSFGPEEQRDFSEIDEQFRPIVEHLKKKAYFVESAGEYVTVPRLIAEPDLLDDARKFMRRKGEECLAEADRLDELHAAVTAPPTFI